MERTQKRIAPKSPSEWVALYFHDDGRKCADCGYCSSWTEAHGERMAECDAVAKNMANECPAWIALRESTPEPIFCSRPEQCAGKGQCQKQFDTGYCCNH